MRHGHTHVGLHLFCPRYKTRHTCGCARLHTRERVEAGQREREPVAGGRGGCKTKCVDIYGKTTRVTLRVFILYLVDVFARVHAPCHS